LTLGILPSEPADVEHVTIKEGAMMKELGRCAKAMWRQCDGNLWVGAAVIRQARLLKETRE